MRWLSIQMMNKVNQFSLRSKEYCKKNGSLIVMFFLTSQRSTDLSMFIFVPFVEYGELLGREGLHRHICTYRLYQYCHGRVHGHTYIISSYWYSSHELLKGMLLQYQWRGRKWQRTSCTWVFSLRLIRLVAMDCNTTELLSALHTHHTGLTLHGEKSTSTSVYFLPNTG